MKHGKTPGNTQDAGARVLRTNFRKIERREWWLWMAAAVITLLLTVALASFLLPNSSSPRDFQALYVLPQSVRGLVALVFLFDLYTIYQQVQIHRIRRQLNEREEMYRLISENAEDLIAVVDTQGRRLYNSPGYEKVFGYTHQELQGTPVIDQIHPDDAKRVIEARKQAFATNASVRVEYRFQRKDGDWRILESTGSPVKNGAGGFRKLIIVSRDITERKHAD